MDPQEIAEIERNVSLRQNVDRFRRINNVRKKAQLMARTGIDHDISRILNAASQWIDRCLVQDGSVFSDSALWTAPLMQAITTAFIDNPDEGKDNFYTKLSGQLQTASPATKQLMAEMLWALLLFPSNIKPNTKRQAIRDVWAMSGSGLADDLPTLSDAVLIGIGSGGPGFNTHRWRELAYLIRLASDLKARPEAERRALLSDYDRFIEWVAGVPTQGYRQFRHMQGAIDALSRKSYQVSKLFLRDFESRLCPRIEALIEQRRELVREPGLGSQKPVVLHHSNELAKTLV